MRNYIIEIKVADLTFPLNVLESMSKYAKCSDKKFLGMDFEDQRIILVYKNKPKQHVKIKKEIIALLNAY